MLLYYRFFQCNQKPFKVLISLNATYDHCSMFQQHLRLPQCHHLHAITPHPRFHWHLAMFDTQQPQHIPQCSRQQVATIAASSNHTCTTLYAAIHMLLHFISTSIGIWQRLTYSSHSIFPSRAEQRKLLNVSAFNFPTGWLGRDVHNWSFSFTTLSGNHSSVISSCSVERKYWRPPGGWEETEWQPCWERRSRMWKMQAPWWKDKGAWTTVGNYELSKTNTTPLISWWAPVANNKISVINFRSDELFISFKLFYCGNWFFHNAGNRLILTFLIFFYL